jgi:hypothetical protein
MSNVTILILLRSYFFLKACAIPVLVKIKDKKRCYSIPQNRSDPSKTILTLRCGSSKRTKLLQFAEADCKNVLMRLAQVPHGALSQRE